MIGNFFGKAILSLVKALDAYSLRQRVIADNIANIATPGFKRKEVAFEDQLKEALYRGRGLRGITSHIRHISADGGSLEQVEPQIKVTDEGSPDAGGINSVNVEREMAALAKNQLIYTFAANLLSRKFSNIKASIRGRA